MGVLFTGTTALILYRMSVGLIIQPFPPGTAPEPTVPWSLVGGVVSHFTGKKRDLLIGCSGLQHQRHMFKKTW